MRNLIHTPNEQLDAQPTLRRIPRQQRSISEKQFTRSVREAGRRERTLLLRVARAMKQEVQA